MKKVIVCAIALLLTGCAAQNGGLGINQLETPAYLRSERSFSLDFVKIQRAIFRHQAACNSDIEYVGDANLASYARVQKPFYAGATGWNHTIVLGLTHMANVDTKGRMYSYYTPTRAQIREIYNAILDPETCPE